jgi:hypothetical protein
MTVTDNLFVIVCVIIYVAHSYYKFSCYQKTSKIAILADFPGDVSPSGPGQTGLILPYIRGPKMTQKRHFFRTPQKPHF